MKKEEEAYLSGYRITESGQIIGRSGKVIKGWIDKSGYRCFKMGHSVNILAHRLVAFQKFGQALYEPGIEVRHIEGDPLNINFNNITIGTRLQNQADKPPKSVAKSAEAGAKAVRKFTSKEAKEIRALHLNGASYSVLKDIYKVSKSTIAYLIQGKTYSWVI